MKGINVGTDDTANVPNQFELNSIISVNDLFKCHGAYKFPPYLDGSDYCFKVRRAFVNMTGNTTITAKEIGYHVYVSTGNGFLIYRKVIPDVVFQIAETIEFEVTFRFIY